MPEILSPYLSSFFILFREGFEGLLIAMLVFAYLDKMNARHKRPAVFLGLIAGVIFSLLLGLGIRQIASFTEGHEELFSGIVMLTASGMLAYVAFFCQSAKQHVEGKVDRAINTGSSIILSLAVFLAVLREGFEIVLFYAALVTSTIFNTIPVFAGAITGVVALIVVYFGLNKITKIIPMSAFFKVSSYLLFALSIYFGYEGTTDLYAGLRELKVI